MTIFHMIARWVIFAAVVATFMAAAPDHIPQTDRLLWGILSMLAGIGFVLGYGYPGKED